MINFLVLCMISFFRWPTDKFSEYFFSFVSKRARFQKIVFLNA